MVARRARAVMVLGTASNVGKSLIVTALCRHLKRAGVSVAPFKAQNMSLNSAATPDGREIGRAQALQAEAAGVVPSADMNPVLLKPTSDRGSQAVVQGELFGSVDARDFGGGTRRRFWPYVVESYDRLASAYDVIVIEGAGSPAEINLRSGDIVNMAMAHEADARCLLVGDIDRGGVFASVYGTLALLDDADRARIDAYAINKFRGDASLLDSGIAELSARTGIACLGVIPYLREIGLDEEDGMPIERRRVHGPWPLARTDERLRMAVVPFPHLANFTDFDALDEEPSVDLRYTAASDDLVRADVVVVPGTKDTLADLRWLYERGLREAILSKRAGRTLVGICGGMQMLGHAIHDPDRIESGGTLRGLGLLALETTLSSKKVTVPVRGRTVAASVCGGEARFDGYEIHVGMTAYASDLAPFAMLTRAGATQTCRDGGATDDGSIVGTYVHGLFDDDDFRHAFLAQARRRSALPPAQVLLARRALREGRIDRLADTVANALALEKLFPELERLVDREDAHTAVR